VRGGFTAATLVVAGHVAGCGFTPLHAASERSACPPTTVVAQEGGAETVAAALEGARLAIREEGARCGTVQVTIVRSSYGAGAIAAVGGFPRAQSTEVFATVSAKWLGEGGHPEELAPVTVVVPVPSTSNARTATLGEASAMAQAAFEAGRRATLRALGHPVAGDAIDNQ
jgi:hypothetical protein